MSSLPIAYAMKKKSKKMAMGGDPSSDYGDRSQKGVHLSINPSKDETAGESGAGFNTRQGGRTDNALAKAKHKRVLHEMKSMPKPKLMAEGGQITDNYQSPGNPEVDGGNVCPTCNMPTPHEGNDVKPGASHMEMNQMGDSDEGAGDMDSVDPFVRKIMMGQAKGYSKGGKVSNEDAPMADSMPNDFDDLELDDNLSSSYGDDDNSGDSLGDSQEADDREDIIHRIMKSRSKKDRMPHPA